MASVSVHDVCSMSVSAGGVQSPLRVGSGSAAQRTLPVGTVGSMT